jgi:hypothetical protein
MTLERQVILIGERPGFTMRVSPEYGSHVVASSKRRAGRGHPQNESVDGNVAANAERNGEQQRQCHSGRSDKMPRRISDVDEDTKQSYTRCNSKAAGNRLVFFEFAEWSGYPPFSSVPARPIANTCPWSYLLLQPGGEA